MTIKMFLVFEEWHFLLLLLLAVIGRRQTKRSRVISKYFWPGDEKWYPDFVRMLTHLCKVL